MAEAFSASGYDTFAYVRGPLVAETKVLRGFRQVHHIVGDSLPFMAWREDALNKLQGLTHPWFMLLHLWEVHRPYRSPPDFKKRLGRKGYEAAVTATDSALAPVLGSVPDDTIIAITGDHGERYANSYLGDRFAVLAREIRRRFKEGALPSRIEQKLGDWSVGHGFTLDEELVRVPLSITGPGVPVLQSDDQVRHVDLFPTLSDLCGVGLPQELDGRSLRPLLEGRQLVEEPAYMEATGVTGGSPILGVRTSQWKYLKGARAEPQLFGLADVVGPDEKTNLIQQEPEIAEQLAAELAALLGRSPVGSPGMTAQEEAVVEEHLRDLGYL